MSRALFIFFISLGGTVGAVGQVADPGRSAEVEWAYANQSYLASKIESLEESLSGAQAELTRLRQLYAEGLIPRQQVEQAEAAVGDWQTRLALLMEQKKVADEYLATTEMQERWISQLGKNADGRGMEPVTRHDGQGTWSREDFERLAAAFQHHFGRALPVSAMGQTATHARLGLDHQNRMDIAIHPDSQEGAWIVEYLRARGIPFIAFISRVPGSATGPHIHVGLPSSRLETFERP